VDRTRTIASLLLVSKHLQIGSKKQGAEVDECRGSNPSVQFDLFVENGDPRIGIFAASFAAHLLSNYMVGVPGEDDRQFLPQVADLIHDYPETQVEIAKLTDGLNESVATINYMLQNLNQDD
jgi:hypothetical protein